MKKNFVWITPGFICGLLLLAGLLLSFTPQPAEKVYIFKLTESQVQATYQALDASTAPHTLIKEVENILLTQYQAQQAKPVADTTKHK